MWLAACVWALPSPGSTRCWRASISRAPAGAPRPAPTAVMRSSSIRMSARVRVGGAPTRRRPPRMIRLMRLLRPLLLLGQEVVRVDLLETHLALELEVLRVEIARLLDPCRLELPNGHLAAGHLFRVHEARAHLGRADGAVRIHLGMMRDHVAHALLEMLRPEGVVRSLEGGTEESLETLWILGDGVF